MRLRPILAGLPVLAALFFPTLQAYSVLTHEAIVDTVWHDSIEPALLKRFPNATKDDLRQAHAYTYGGCIIQDMGYYPLGNHFFSNLTHYVRSADFVQALVDESRNLNEYAFALGAVAHFGADIEGHSIAVNRSVPVLYPKLRQKYGDIVTYEDNPSAHLKTEFGFDVLQVARGHYATTAYHDFIGFQVSKDLLDRAFSKTYGLTLKDLFPALDLSLGTYRFAVSKLLPNITKGAWALKSDEIKQDRPGIERRQFVYNLRKSNYQREWGGTYQHPSFAAKLLAFFLRLLPPIGPFRTLAFKVPTPQTEKMFEASFDVAARRDHATFADAMTGKMSIINRDLDTGNPVSPGEYALTDQTYDQLLRDLAARKFANVTPELRANILGFYARMKTPDPHGIDAQLQALKILHE